MTQDYEQRFITARKQWIAGRFSQLNEQQLQGVLDTEGPVLLLAGAGSGKTTVLINRIANLIRFGCASDSTDIPDYITEGEVRELETALQAGEKENPRVDAMCALNPVAPWSIMAITFTNKAANELKSRLEAMLGPQAQDVWAMTFHSACCRILRREIERLGYSSSFTIYDTADSERVMKDVIRDTNMDDKAFPVKSVMNLISKAKDRQQYPPEFHAMAKASGDFRLEKIAQAYAEYQKRLKEANALDFDDIILLTVKILQDYDEVRDYYQRKFRYVLVDEYQDTNNLQYLLTALLAGRYENLCVVGDDDQSIYKFRGATIDNILSFEKQFRAAKVIRLEQNYRSTKSILQAANAVIQHNRGRKGKTLWTQNSDGEKIAVYEAMNEADEANYVARRIFALSKDSSFRDFAILYRTNAQSNALEYAFKRNAIPYRIIGGTRFFDRAEVKDMLAYLRVIHNPDDDLRLSRIINNPPRGLGAKSLEAVQRLAESAGSSMYRVIAAAGDYPMLEKSANKLKGFTDMIARATALLSQLALPEFYDELLKATGYEDMLLTKDDIENRTRLENVRELKSSIISYMQNAEEPSLGGFLEEIALYTDIEQYDANADAVVMMTMHAAKGLEFPHVFIVGAEEGLFPGMRAIGDEDELEEERRLCYVAVTRAKKTLSISYADQRMLYGRTTASKVSRFVEEIPEELVSGGRRPKPTYESRTAYSNTFGGGWQDEPSAPVRARPQPTITVQKPSAPLTEFKVGETVSHSAFGRGMVLSVVKTGNDALLEIAFDNKGTKRLMARTASEHMKKL